jgi:hypoxanthine phosphoribosyltransferase
MSGIEPTLFYIPYEQFLADVEAVALQLEAGAWKPDFLVGIGRGGLVPAAYLSHRLDIAMLSVDHSSGEPGFGEELLVKLAGKIMDGRRILVVDDINDSGTTIACIRAAIAAKGGNEDQLRVAVLINNSRSKAKAEYEASRIDRNADKRWFVFPWEALGRPEALLVEALSVPERLA